MRGTIVILASGLVLAALAREARAAELRLSWRAPTECPSGDDVRAAAMRGAPAGDSSSAGEPVEAEGVVEHDATWKVKLRTSRGDREIEASSCTALADATAVVLALTMFPAGSAPTEPSPNTDPLRAGTPSDERSVPSMPRRPHAWGIAAAAAIDSGALPATTLGGALSLAWTPGRARIEIDGGLYGGQERTTSSATHGARMSLATAGGRGCWAVLRSPIEIAPCGGAEVMLLSAHGFGTDHDHDAGATWLAASGGVLVRVPIGSRIALRGALDALVPLSRPELVVDGDGPVHRPAPLGARVALGAELLFF